MKCYKPVVVKNSKKDYQAIGTSRSGMYRSLLEDLFTADQDQEDIAAAMLMLIQGKQKLILPPDPPMDKRRRDRNDRGDRRENHAQLNVVVSVKAMATNNRWIYIVSKWVVRMV